MGEEGKQQPPLSTLSNLLSSLDSEFSVLNQEVYKALVLVKRLGPDVWEGKRRQFNYIVFQRLTNDKFGDRSCCIVITVNKRPCLWFLRNLVEHLHLPVYGMVNSYYYGFNILTTYRFGSMQMVYDAKLMRVPDMRWFGVLSFDFKEFNLPDLCLLNLTPEDKRKVEAMLSRCYLIKDAPQWRTELEVMLHKGVKFEIEALSANIGKCGLQGTW